MNAQEAIDEVELLFKERAVIVALLIESKGLYRKIKALCQRLDRFQRGGVDLQSLSDALDALERLRDEIEPFGKERSENAMLPLRERAKAAYLVLKEENLLDVIPAVDDETRWYGNAALAKAARKASHEALYPKTKSTRKKAKSKPRRKYAVVNSSDTPSENALDTCVVCSVEFGGIVGDTENNDKPFHCPTCNASLCFGCVSKHNCENP